VRTDRALLAAHASGVVLALGAALFWPRPGQAALIVPVGSDDLAPALQWADREAAPLLELDTARGRVIARVTDNASLLRALGAGLVPIAARAAGCSPPSQETKR
jgi:hypothetical protein